MHDDLNTADSLLSWMHEQSVHKGPIDPQMWLSACMKLNILSSDENDKLIELEMQVAQERVALLKQVDSVAESKLLSEASPLYAEMRKQKAKVAMIEECIRLGKITARLKQEELMRA